MATKLKDVPAILVRNYVAGGINTLLVGEPAIGKTETIEAFCEQMAKRVKGFRLWRFYAPTMSPMDIQASAPDYETGLLRMFNNEALPNRYNDPDAKGVLFLGELNNADQTTSKLLQKYINNEDMSGVLRKPEGVMVVADSNRIEDKSGTQQQGRALMSRFEQIPVFTDASDNIEFAAKNGWHPAVQLFFKDNPAVINNYAEVFETRESLRNRGAGAQQANGSDLMAEEGRRGIWANMRSWERISKKEYAADELNSPVTLSELTGNLGSGVGAAYSAHKDFLSKLTSFEEIMKAPAKVDIPPRIDEQHALAMVVAMKCNEEQMDAVHAFGKRLPLDLQAVILRNLAARKGFNVAKSAAYNKWITDKTLVGLISGRVAA